MKRKRSDGSELTEMKSRGRSNKERRRKCDPKREMETRRWKKENRRKVKEQEKKEINENRL